MNKKFYVVIIKIMAPFFMILIPAMMLYGLIFPWKPAIKILSKYEHSVALLSGLKSTYNNGYEKESRTYLIIKKNPLSSKVVRITIDSKGLLEVKQHNGGFLVMLLVYIFLGLLTWWSWFRAGNQGMLRTELI